MLDYKRREDQRLSTDSSVWVLLLVHVVGHLQNCTNDGAPWNPVIDWACAAPFW